MRFVPPGVVDVLLEGLLDLEMVPARGGLLGAAIMVLLLLLLCEFLLLLAADAVSIWDGSDAFGAAIDSGAMTTIVTEYIVQ